MITSLSYLSFSNRLSVIVFIKTITQLILNLSIELYEPLDHVFRLSNISTFLPYQ